MLLTFFLIFNKLYSIVYLNVLSNLYQGLNGSNILFLIACAAEEVKKLKKNGLNNQVIVIEKHDSTRKLQPTCNTMIIIYKLYYIHYGKP